MSLTTSEALLEKIVAALSGIGGMQAIVLGGSRGRGAHTAASDYDIGLYYRGDLDIAALERAARALDTPVDGRAYQPRAADAPLMTGIGGWGPWVNGGGWLTIDGQPVDILYRDAARVEHVIGDVCEGRFECAYHYGHPHAFVSTIYAGEVATCRALHDPHGFVAACKTRLDPYPEALRTATIARFNDEARFFVAIAKKAAEQGNIMHTAGCIYRAAACLLQCVFAINREWLINEKGALALTATFAQVPPDLVPRVERAFMLSTDPAVLQRCLNEIGALGYDLGLTTVR